MRQTGLLPPSEGMALGPASCPGPEWYRLAGGGVWQYPLPATQKPGMKPHHADDAPRINLEDRVACRKQGPETLLEALSADAFLKKSPVDLQATTRPNPNIYELWGVIRLDPGESANAKRGERLIELLPEKI